MYVMHIVVVVTGCDAFIIVASIILTRYNVVVNRLMRLLKVLEQLLLAIIKTIFIITSITKTHISIKPTTIMHSSLFIYIGLVMHRLDILDVIIVTHIIQHLQMFIFTIQLILDLHLYLLWALYLMILMLISLIVIILTTVWLYLLDVGYGDVLLLGLLLLVLLLVYMLYMLLL